MESKRDLVPEIAKIVKEILIKLQQYPERPGGIIQN